MRHLNDNAAYYSRAIWLLMDAGGCRALLEQFLALNRGLLARLGDTPIATFGKWLIFPLIRTTVTEGEEIDSNDYRRVQLVSLPSRGLLAEAELGSCNACEERDVTRAMDWPLTQPTPITGVTPGPRGQQPTVPQPASLPAPVVAIQQAPAAPDPVGLAGALGLLGQPNIFRDMSGLQQVSQLLDDLVNGTVSETNAALRAASARAALRGSGADSSGGGTGGVPSRRSAPSTTDPGRQVDRLKAIQYAYDQGRITNDQANDAAMGVLGGEVLPASFETFFGAPTGPAPGVQLPGSSPQEAVALIPAFATAGGNSTAWMNLGRDQVAQRLEQLVLDPDLVEQRQLNLCGPAIFLRTWLRYDPVAVMHFASELYDTGQASFGGYRVEPTTDGCRGTDYGQLKATQPAAVPEAAEWMIMCALRDSENAVLNFEGRPGEDISAITIPGEVAMWLSATQLFSRIRNETVPFHVPFLTRGLDHLAAMAPTSGRVVILLVDASPLPDTNVPWIQAQFPNHYIGLRSAILPLGDNIDLDYWSWGQNYSNIKIPKDAVRASYYGAIVLER